MPAPEVVVAKPGDLDAGMRSMGKLDGQHKLPRIDGSGRLTVAPVAFLEARGAIGRVLEESGEARG